jgi:hypothetical protein
MATDTQIENAVSCMNEAIGKLHQLEGTISSPLLTEIRQSLVESRSFLEGLSNGDEITRRAENPNPPVTLEMATPVPAEVPVEAPNQEAGTPEVARAPAENEDGFEDKLPTPY